MKRILFLATFLYAVTTHAVLTLPDKAELGLPANYALNGGVERGLATFARYNDSFTVTITNASPAVITSVATVPQIGDGIVFTTTGALPTGLTANTVYFVVATAQGGTYGFTVSATKGGTAIATTSAGSGTHTASPTRPYKGLGGTPTHVALASSNASPIQGARSLVVSNSGSTAATGEGFSIPLNIDQVDRGIMLNVSFSYIVQSGTFQVGNTTTTPLTDSDLEVFLWDVTNGVAIQVAPTLLQCGGVGTKCDYTGQTVVPPGAGSYRLLFHTVTPNALAWSVKFDSFNVSRVVRTLGLNGSDLKLVANPIVTATTTAPTRPTSGVTETYQLGRVGDHAHVVWNYASTATTGSAVGSGDYLFSLPLGLSFDPTKVTFNTAVNTFPINGGLGTVTIGDGSNHGVGQIYPYDATRFRVYVAAAGTNTNRYIVSSTNFPFGQNAVQKFSFDFFAPIAGWSAGGQMSDQSPSVPVQLSVYRAAALSNTTAQSTVIFDTVTTDTHAGYSAAAGTYTFKVPGWYHCDAKHNAVAVSNFSYVNGFLLLDALTLCTSWSGNTSYNGAEPRCSKDFYANANQVLKYQMQAGSTYAMTTGPDYVYLTCHKTNQGLGITAADPQYSDYGLTSTLSVAVTTPVKLDTKIDDASGLYNATTGQWTTKQPGLYKLTVNLFSSNSAPNGIARINSNPYKYFVRGPGNGLAGNGSVEMRLASGVTVDYVLDIASSLAGPAGGAYLNTATFERIGP